MRRVGIHPKTISRGDKRGGGKSDDVHPAVLQKKRKEEAGDCLHIPSSPLVKMIRDLAQIGTIGGGDIPASRTRKGEE